MKTKTAMLLWLLSITLPAPALAHIEVSNVKKERDVGIVKTCKNGINSIEATTGVAIMWALEKFEGRRNIILAEREEVITNLRGRIGFFVSYILSGEGSFSSGRIFVSTCGKVFELSK